MEREIKIKVPITFSQIMATCFDRLFTHRKDIVFTSYVILEISGHRFLSFLALYKTGSIYDNLDKFLLRVASRILFVNFKNILRRNPKMDGILNHAPKILYKLIVTALQEIK